MKKNIIKLATISLLAIASNTAYADIDHDQAKKLMDAGNILPLETILIKARKFKLGKIIELELDIEKDNIIYEVEFLTTEGDVIKLLFDAHSGKLLSKESIKLKVKEN